MGTHVGPPLHVGLAQGAACKQLSVSMPHPHFACAPATRSHGSRPSSRIGALHGPSSACGSASGSPSGSSLAGGSPAGGSPPLLATTGRAARHAELSAERRRREEAEAAAKEAERLSALVGREGWLCGRVEGWASYGRC